MEDQFLFALRNTGKVFRVFLEELKTDGSSEILEEYISLSPLPVEECVQIKNPNQIFQNDRLLAHSPFALDTSNAHKFMGYAPLKTYYDSLRNGHHQRITLAETAHEILNTHPLQTIPEGMNAFVEANEKASFHHNYDTS